ncbi:helix-turn-helix domain-containing protein [Spirosoma foliorum]|uniref:Helix-turn-helix transcriptional regulator n=1 Tax=Spirosoma foliorum TaxID=2710596 RepID=A0A7G5H338_9BACT|nr:AraC family transcriptional regulator [Spirosoma foliorum]QMW05530.1 helix-turn-helix transcriptional regulator [Spirosoma foliorum]
MTSVLDLRSFYANTGGIIEPPATETGHFNIIKVEELALPRHKPVSYSRRSYFKVSLVFGQSKIHYADQCMEIKESALVFTNPMIPYSWERISEEQTGFICLFTEDFFSRFGKVSDYPVFTSAASAVVPLNTHEAGQFHVLFLRMIAELNGQYTFKYDLLRCLLLEIILESQKKQPAAGKPSIGSTAYERIVLLFTELLERQFPIEVATQRLKLSSPSAFANQLNIHVNHLNKALKEITGQTTSQLINRRMIQEAKSLLKTTNWSVNEIAWSLGFDEPNHFSSFYKHNTGLTAKQFRVLTID